MINVNIPIPMYKLFKIKAIFGTIVFFSSIYFFAEKIIDVENKKTICKTKKV